MTALGIVLCATLALLVLTGFPPRAALPIDQQPRSDENQDEPVERRRLVPPRGGKAIQLAWAGYGFAIGALLGHLAYPAADALWAAMLATAIISVPLAAAISLFGDRSRKPPRK